MRVDLIFSLGSAPSPLTSHSSTSAHPDHSQPEPVSLFSWSSGSQRGLWNLPPGGVIEQGDEVALLATPQTTSYVERGEMNQSPWAGEQSEYAHAILIFLKPEKGGCVHLNMTKKKKKQSEKPPFLNWFYLILHQPDWSLVCNYKSSNNSTKTHVRCQNSLKATSITFFCIKHALILTATCWPKSVSTRRDGPIRSIRKPAVNSK